MFKWIAVIAVMIPLFAMSQASGPLRVSRINPRYLVSAADTTKAIYLTGFHFWDNAIDAGQSDPPEVFPYSAYLDSMVRYGHNFIRLWAGWHNTNKVVEYSGDFRFGQNPYRRTGPGNANDGKPRFDLTQFDDSFFTRLRARCDSARNRGMYVAVQMFNGWVTNSPSHGFSASNPWVTHPYNVANNVNGVDGDSDNDNNGEESQRSPYGGGGGIQAIWNLQVAYMKRMIDELNDMDNIIWETSNEAEDMDGTGKHYPWSRLVIDTIHAYERRMPSQHLVWYTGDWGIVVDSQFVGPAACIAPGGNPGSISWDDAPPDSGGRRVVIQDTDHTYGMLNVDGVPLAWKNLTSGQDGIVLQDNNFGCWPVWTCGSSLWPPFKRAMGQTALLATRADLLHMTPQPNKSSTSNDVLFGGATGEVIVYQASGSISVDLTEIAGTVDVTWYDPDDFISIAGTTTTGGTLRTFTPPDARYDVLYVRSATPASVPPAPILATPANGATGVVTNPALIWNASSGATSYRVQVSTVSGFTTTVVDQSNVTTTSWAANGLVANTLYYWRVNATNSGGTSAFSTTFSFTTLAPPPPPVVPVLATPANGATGVGTNPTLAWNASAGATSYRVQLSTVSGFTSTVIDQSDVTTTSFAASSLVANTLYYWRVSATNSGGTSAFSAAFNFTTAATPTTLAIYQNAALSSPWNDMRSYSVTRTYSNTTPAYEGASSLRLAYSAWGSLQFGQGNWSSFVALNPTQYQSLDFAIHGGASGATINVRCLNASGGSMAAVVVTAPANTWQLKSIPMSQLATAPFVAIEFGANTSVTCYLDNLGLTPAGTTQLPAAPVLATPTNGTTGVATNPTLTWSASSGATSYRVQVSTLSGFATTVVDQGNVAATSFALSSLAANTLHYWRVSAANSVGTSAFSTTFNFTTTAPPSPPVLATPANGATGVVTNSALTWNASSGATSYRVQVSTVSGFTTTVVDQSNVTTTSFALSSLVTNTLYYWRVSATNSGGTSAYSTHRNFTTAVGPTTVAIYQNAALSSPWNDMRSYSVTRTYSNTTPAYEGASSLRLAYSAWGSLQFGQGNWSSFVALNPTQYQSLDFAIHGGASGATINVRCLNASGGSMAAVVVTAPANTWQLKSIPMSQLATAPFVAIEFGANTSVTCYLDNLGLTLADSPTILVVTMESEDGAIEAKWESGARAPMNEEGEELATTQKNTGPTSRATTLRVSAIGDSLSYQWQRDGVDIPDGNSHSYIVLGGNTAGMRCIVSNPFGADTSREVLVSHNSSSISPDPLTNENVAVGELPLHYSLEQNYPNPFNPVTTIKYDLPNASQVTLRLFNTLGQEVAALVSEEQEAGYKSVEWNASGFASGVYFYRLQAGEFVQTRRLLLLQ